MERIDFIKTLGIMAFGAATGLKDMLSGLNQLKLDENRMPALFIGHGSPMNALSDNPYTKALNKLGAQLKPKAIIVVSAHWLTKGTWVSTAEKPETIYDFHGFPKSLYEVKYPAPGSPETARLVSDTVKSIQIKEDSNWGLDHGAWSILVHLFPKADIPVFELSIDYSKDIAFHYELAGQLKKLRDKGVLIIGSGNVVHNLGKLDWSGQAPTFDWTIEFDEKVKQSFLNFDHNNLINYQKWGKISSLAHPSNDHYLPLLYVAGLQDKNEKVEFVYEGYELGSISMRCIKIG